MATVTLSRPEISNRVGPEMAAELRDVCQAVQEHETIRLVVLTGAGNQFSVGREPMPENVAGSPDYQRSDRLRNLQAASAIAAIQVPVIVAINGDAMDHGLELAIAGDIRVAVSHAKFGVTDLAGGVFPWDGATQRLPRLIGPGWARDMILTSRIIDAEQALAVGLVSRVVDSERLMEETLTLAETILAGGPIAARYAKEAVSHGMDLTLDQGLRLEADLNVLLQSTTDRAEGLGSFLEKRPPKYTGT
ncbi:MAG: enoyl-CoA hydratase-related protein [Dehalococcoidia bacterium]|nr:enoyl-CoA hydratase-related protein [Dehalococcoidia bacterium]